MQKSGFAIVVGHGVTEDLVLRLRQASTAFFSQVSEEKLKYCHGPYGNDKGGYTAQGVEAVGRTLNLSDGNQSEE